MVANARSFQRVLRVAPNPDVAQTPARPRHQVGHPNRHAGPTTVLPQGHCGRSHQARGKSGLSGCRAALCQRRLALSCNSIGTRSAFGRRRWDSFRTSMQPVQQAIQRDQSLATLFGSQDYCATDDCTSVLSPAAYLCDLLLWLRNHPQGAQTALDVLDSRRPDIRHLLLNCPNTDTELPYIDLVNELLADKISPPPSASTTLTSAITGSQNSIPVTSDAGFPSPNFYISIGSEVLLVTAVGGGGNTTWTVSRGQQGTTPASALNGAAVTLTSTINPLWKQTSADLTAAQLSAAPEYFNQAAYLTLFGASYPQSLPYSAGLDELRTYLQQWNLPLWQLRQALLPLSGVTIAQQAAVAAERFGMPPHGGRSGYQPELCLRRGCLEHRQPPDRRRSLYPLSFKPRPSPMSRCLSFSMWPGCRAASRSRSKGLTTPARPSKQALAAIAARRRVPGSCASFSQALARHGLQNVGARSSAGCPSRCQRHAGPKCSGRPPILPAASGRNPPRREPAARLLSEY